MCDWFRLKYKRGTTNLRFVSGASSFSIFLRVFYEPNCVECFRHFCVFIIFLGVGECYVDFATEFCDFIFYRFRTETVEEKHEQIDTHMQHTCRQNVATTCLMNADLQECIKRIHAKKISTSNLGDL